MKHQILVVDDHPVMRWGYMALINQEPDLEVCGEAGNAEDALVLIDELKPSLALVDVSLDGMNGIELTKHALSKRQDLPILVVSMHDESLYGQRALRAGARGYLMKRDARRQVVEAIRKILGGAFYISEALSTQILSQYQGRASGGLGSALEVLSDRELEVFELVGRGRSTRQIAEALHISPKTVESHRNRLKEKLAIETMPELMRRAIQWVEIESVS
jgi:DNA-binding NarL/FixJ family response regulator